MSKELQTILKEHDRLRGNGEKAILATVVDVKGSSYRLPGAKMLVTEDGKTFGTVSGGCLEADVLERAKTVLKTGRPQVITYDTTRNVDSVFSLNMGCRGVVRILLEPTENNFIFEFVKHCFEKNTRGVVATLIGASDAKAGLIGHMRKFVEEKQTHFLADSVAPSDLINDCFKTLDENLSRCQVYETTDGTDEFFLEVIKPPPSLVVFGAGQDALALVETAKNLGWSVSVVDHRPAYATAERFPRADKIICARPEKLFDHISFDENTVAVVMTHNYAHDYEILRFLLNSKASYVGALGPKRRTESLLQDLRETGEVFTSIQLQKLYGPAGLDIGAETPELIALSIIAEINAVLADRSGGFLRERQGSIYNRNARAL